MHLRRLVIPLLVLAACPAGDDTDTGTNSVGDTGGSTGMTGTVTSDGDCPSGTSGCPCLPDLSCEALHICVDGTCEVDTESDSGPTTASVTDTSTSMDTGTDASSDGSGTDTGTGACSVSTDCPKGQVCIATAASPGVPAEPFRCSEICAGLGPDADVCTDDASCCGAFCDEGSCLAP